MEKLIKLDENNSPYLELIWEDCVYYNQEFVIPNKPLGKRNSIVIMGSTINKLHKLEEKLEQSLEEIDCLKTERNELKEKIELMAKEFINFEKMFSQIGTIVTCPENHRVYCGECEHSEVCSADNQIKKRLNGDKCKHYNKKK